MKSQIVLKDKTLVDILKYCGTTFADKTFMRRFQNDKFVDISFGQFVALAERIAGGLISLGLEKGDRVAILSENRPEWGASYLGTLVAGGISVPLDALLKISAWSHILRDSQSKFLIVSRNFLPDFEQVVDEIPDLKMIISMDEVDQGSTTISLSNLEKKAKSSNQTFPDVIPSDLAAIIYTSGTTGQAKGVMLTHTNIVSDIDGMLHSFELFVEDNFLSVLPIHHTFECTCGFLTPLAGGASITYARGLASKLIIEDIKTNKATILLGVPLLFEKMHTGLLKAISKKPIITKVLFNASFGVSKLFSNVLGIEAGKQLFKSLREKAGLSSIRLMVAGGAPMPPEISKDFALLGFKFIQGYGLTEASPVLTLNPYEKPKDASIGVAIYGSEIKVVESDNRGIGHIVARGPMIMKGYYKNQAATDEVLKDGWLYTGDSGWVDDEGYYYMAGRLKNVIVTPAGKNVYPEEIEAELNKSPYILESLVLGRSLKGTRGEEIEAIVVPDYDYFDALATELGTKYSTEDIEKQVKSEVSRLSSGLAEFKKVKYIEIREEEFEKTSTKKIKRYLFTQKSQPINSKSDMGKS